MENVCIEEAKYCKKYNNLKKIFVLNLSSEFNFNQSIKIGFEFKE